MQLTGPNALEFIRWETRASVLLTFKPQISASPLIRLFCTSRGPTAARPHC